jgi:hypothetical protein
MAGEEYKHVGDHAQSLEGGGVLAPGETITLTTADVSNDHTTHLIVDGILAPMSELLKADEAEQGADDSGKDKPPKG